MLQEWPLCALAYGRAWFYVENTVLWHEEWSVSDNHVANCFKWVFDFCRRWALISLLYLWCETGDRVVQICESRCEGSKFSWNRVMMDEIVPFAAPEQWRGRFCVFRASILQMGIVCLWLSCTWVRLQALLAVVALNVYWVQREHSFSLRIVHDYFLLWFWLVFSSNYFSINLHDSIVWTLF